jgi:hypothetical protein
MSVQPIDVNTPSYEALIIRPNKILWPIKEKTALIAVKN